MAGASAHAQGWFRNPTPNDTLQSVRVLPDGKVLFQIYTPKARKVQVTGDLPYWNEATGAWDLEYGKLQLLVGSASDDIRETAEVRI